MICPNYSHEGTIVFSSIHSRSTTPTIPTRVDAGSKNIVGLKEYVLITG